MEAKKWPNPSLFCFHLTVDCFWSKLPWAQATITGMSQILKMEMSFKKAATAGVSYSNICKPLASGFSLMGDFWRKKKEAKNMPQF